MDKENHIFTPEQLFLIKKSPLRSKIIIAQVLLQEAISEFGNKIIIGYSGGKDSKVILHLAREINPNIIAVHNSHPEETCDLESGCLIIKQPKTNFAEFLKYVDVEAQIDGTRVCEEGKTVFVEGKEIERSEMNSLFNSKGVFNLQIVYPILFWSDKDVWDYIDDNNLMTAYEISIYKSSRPYVGEKNW